MDVDANKEFHDYIDTRVKKLEAAIKDVKKSQCLCTECELDKLKSRLDSIVKTLDEIN